MCALPQLSLDANAPCPVERDGQRRKSALSMTLTPLETKSDLGQEDRLYGDGLAGEFLPIAPRCRSFVGASRTKSGGSMSSGRRRPFATAPSDKRMSTSSTKNSTVLDASPRLPPTTRQSIAGSLMSEEEISLVMSGSSSPVISTVVGGSRRSSTTATGREEESEEIDETEEETCSIHTATRVSILSPSSQAHRVVSASSLTFEGAAGRGGRSVGSMSSYREDVASPTSTWVRVTSSGSSIEPEPAQEGRATKLLEEMLSSVEAEQQHSEPPPRVNRQSFLMLPPTLFPHTPLPRQRISTKPVAPLSLPRRAVSREVVRKRRSSIHLGPSNRRSKHATGPRGSTALRVDHARTTRGKFWAPINPVYEEIVIRPLAKKASHASPPTPTKLLERKKPTPKSMVDLPLANSPLQTPISASQAQTPRSRRGRESVASFGTLKAKEDIVCDVPLSAIALGTANGPWTRVADKGFVSAKTSTLLASPDGRKVPLVSCLKRTRTPRSLAVPLRFTAPSGPPPRAPLPPVPRSCDSDSCGSHDDSSSDSDSGSTADSESDSESVSSSASSRTSDSDTCSGSCSSRCSACHPSVGSPSSINETSRNSCSTCNASTRRPRSSTSYTPSYACSTCSTSFTCTCSRSPSCSSISSSSTSSTSSRCPHCQHVPTTRARMTIHDGNRTTFEMVLPPSRSAAAATATDPDATPRARRFPTRKIVDPDPPRLPSLPDFSPFVIDNWTLSTSSSCITKPGSPARHPSPEAPTPVYAYYPADFCADAHPSSALTPRQAMPTPRTALLHPETPRKSLNLRYSYLVSPMPVNLHRTSVAVPTLENNVASPKGGNTSRAEERRFLLQPQFVASPDALTETSPVQLRHTLAPQPLPPPRPQLSESSSSSSMSSTWNKQQHQTLPAFTTLNRQVRLQELRRRRNEKRLDALAKLEGGSSASPFARKGSTRRITAPASHGRGQGHNVSNSSSDGGALSSNGGGKRADVKKKLLSGLDVESFTTESLTYSTTSNESAMQKLQRQEAIEALASGVAAGFDMGSLPLLSSTSGEEAILRSHLRALDQARLARSYARSQFIDH